MPGMFRIAAVAVCAASSLLLAGEHEADSQNRTSPLEVGVYSTIHYQRDLASNADPQFGIGEAELAATVRVGNEIIAAASLMSHGRLEQIRINQAVVAWTPSPDGVEFLFGQQAMYHGLQTTRMISDPLILDHVELVCPSLIVTSPFFDLFRGGFGFTILSRFDEQIQEEIYLHTAVIHIDALLPGGSIVRLSSRANTDGTDITLGGMINQANLSLDAEGLYATAPEGELLSSGLYAGLHYQIGSHLGFAVRVDGLSRAEANFDAMDLRVGSCVIANINNGLFCALELTQRRPREGEPAYEIALAMGLEQKIRLPGFQRRTLTRNSGRRP